MTEEDRDLARCVIDAREDDEHVQFDVGSYATLEWDEDPAPGRDEMTGSWRLAYRDGTSEVIDLPLDSRAEAVDKAKRLIAEKLTTPIWPELDKAAE